MTVFALGLMLQVFWRPVHFGMQRRQLLNLKRLVEGKARSVVVLVVGIPGAGKTVLIDRATKSPEWTVLDKDRLRRRLPPALRRIPVVYPVYVLALVDAIARRRYVVAESRGTYAWLRRLVTACARARGREAVIVLLDAPTEEAIAGQKVRGRVAPAPVMQANTTSWGPLLDAARSGALAAQEGWSKVVVLDRAQASEVEDLGELIAEPTAAGLRGQRAGLSADQVAWRRKGGGSPENPRRLPSSVRARRSVVRRFGREPVLGVVDPRAEVQEPALGGVGVRGES